MNTKLRIVFAGTPVFGLPALKRLKEAGHSIIAVYTQPDRPAGRGRKLQMSPVKEWALHHRISVYQPLNFKDPDTVATLADIKPDVIVVIAYGLLLPKTVLDIPPLGCVNVHASLLPRWRGASPIQHAICHGDTQSGITIMQMDTGMDTGDILQCVSCPIAAEDTAGILHDRLSVLAVEPLLSSLNELAGGLANPQPQDNRLATYAPKISREDACIRWKDNVSVIDCCVRGYNPWPTAYTHMPSQEVLRVISGSAFPEENPTAPPGTILSIDRCGIRVACGKGVYRIESLQFAGRKAMQVTQWLNGSKEELQPGLILGNA